MLHLLRYFSLIPAVALAQEAPPAMQRPADAERPSLVEWKNQARTQAPKHTLDQDFELQVVAAPPLVQHPIMGTTDAEGNLYVGDAVGVNWNKSELEQAPPNRVLKLIDTNRDGFYDKSVVFADHMTFPQGACWLNGSLYVASPPGIWKLTDKDGDGVAEEREMIVGGFDYTGNAADVHGPKVHPNGRLYWCHGRKGHKVTHKDGTLVHEGKASGVWSCLPDGSDVRWHALGGADNPTSLAFTPKGEIVGTTNLYKSQPRSDTIMLWQYGGIYPRRDQMQVVEGLPVTFVDMPSLFDFGHVAVSGISFWNGFAPDATAPLMVTHFNTQRLVRMEFEPEGSAYKLIENEFLKIHEDDVHLTDVFEDPTDGSLLLLNTGGWFRIGCPSSLLAKPEQRGSIYRIRPKTGDKTPPFKAGLAFKNVAEAEAALLKGDSASSLRLAMEALLEHAETSGTGTVLHAEVRTAVQALAKVEQDTYSLQAWLRLTRHHRLFAADALAKAETEVELRQLLWHFRDPALGSEEVIAALLPLLSHSSSSIQTLALETLGAHPKASEKVASTLLARLQSGASDANTLKLVESFLKDGAQASPDASKTLLNTLVGSKADATVSLALRVLAAQPNLSLEDSWKAGFLKRLNTQPSAELLEVLPRYKDATIMAALETLSNDAQQSTTLRIKALSALKSKVVPEATLAWLKEVLSPNSSESLASKIAAGKAIAAAALNAEQLQAFAPWLASVGPIELHEVLPLLKKTKDETVLTALCNSLSQNPALLSQQESAYRSLLSHVDPKYFETLIAPAYKAAELALDQKKASLDELTKAVETQGNAERGSKHFAQGKGSCLACHRVGDLGGIVGPNLSQIGSIRKERDILESVLFPSNTLARDYETQVFELRGGESVMGVVRSHAAEGIIVSDLAGQTRTLAHDQIVSQVTLPTSLMPAGLENTMSRQELLDLIAYFRSLK